MEQKVLCCGCPLLICIDVMKQRIEEKQKEVESEKQQYRELMTDYDRATLEVENLQAEIRKLKRNK